MWWRGQRRDADLNAELEAYRAMLVERYVGQGTPRKEAEFRARVETYGVADRVRETWGSWAAESLWQDVRYAARLMRSSPGFTATAVLTLALGIGANTAVFSVLHAVLLKPLPFDEPQQLGIIWSNFAQTATRRAPTSGVAVTAIATRNRAFSSIGGIWAGGGTLTSEGQTPEQIKLGQVTANFFDVLGARAALGRTFMPEERGGGRPAIVLSDGLWRRRFGGDRAIIGRQVRMENRSFTVVGVMPEGFRMHFPPGSNVPDDLHAWIPFQYPIEQDPVTLYYVRVLGRMRPGVTIEEARRDLDRVAAEMRSTYPAYADEKLGLELAPLHAESVREARPALIALFGGSGLVLLICCVNVANLLLARASARSREIGMRVSLGATTARLAQQLLVESVMLCAVGGVTGLACGWGSIRLLEGIRPEEYARFGQVGLDSAVLAFSSGVTLLAALICALVPLWQASRPAVLRRTPKPALRRGLVAAEVMLSFVLLAASGLLIRTVWHLSQHWPGFDARQTLTFAIDLPGASYGKEVQRERFVREWEAILRTLPGVERVGGASHLPLGDYPNWYSPYRPDGAGARWSGRLADHRAVTYDYLPAMRARLIAGRHFDMQDRADGKQVVIIDSRLAEEAWPGESAVGKRIEVEQMHNRKFTHVIAEVVGVVEHVQHHNLTTQPRGQIYIPYPQSPRPHLTFVVRSREGESEGLEGAIRRELAKVDAGLAVSKVQMLEGYVERAKAPANFAAVLAAAFSALALGLAAIGVYGVISYSVLRRRRELGVRVALGAGRVNLMRLVLGEGLVLIGIGLALGLATSWIAGGWIRGLLFGVAPWDPATYAGAGAAVVVAAVAACARPAWMAAQSDPMEAIRNE